MDVKQFIAELQSTTEPALTGRVWVAVGDVVSNAYTFKKGSGGDVLLLLESELLDEMIDEAYDKGLKAFLESGE